MPFSYNISPNGDQVRIVGTGKITANACVGLFERVITDPRRRPDSAALIDLREAVYEPRGQGDVVQIAQAVE